MATTTSPAPRAFGPRQQQAALTDAESLALYARDLLAAIDANDVARVASLADVIGRRAKAVGAVAARARKG